MTSVAVAPRAVPRSVAADLGALAVCVAEIGPLPADPRVLAERLYQEWYLNIRAAEPRSGPPAPAELDLVPALEAAHAASLRFEPGWIADRVSNTGRVEAVAAGRRLVRPGGYVNADRPGARPEPGDRLRVAAALTLVEGGFWVARSMSFLETGEQPMTRLYVNVRLAGATAAVALLTASLDVAGVPFALKVNLQLGVFQRADALVTYMPRDRFADVRDALAGDAATLADLGHLAPPIPRLTARLRAGIGAADGDDAGASYGQSRCAILAAALAGRAGTEPVERVAVAALAAAGLDPARPYLSPGASHDYAPFD
jgi:hypothetical protein